MAGRGLAGMGSGQCNEQWGGFGWGILKLGVGAEMERAALGWRPEGCCGALMGGGCCGLWVDWPVGLLGYGLIGLPAARRAFRCNAPAPGRIHGPGPAWIRSACRCGRTGFRRRLAGWLRSRRPMVASRWRRFGCAVADHAGDGFDGVVRSRCWRWESATRPCSGVGVQDQGFGLGVRGHGSLEIGLVLTPWARRGWKIGRWFRWRSGAVQVLEMGERDQAVFGVGVQDQGFWVRGEGSWEPWVSGLVLTPLGKTRLEDRNHRQRGWLGLALGLPSLEDGLLGRVNAGDPSWGRRFTW